ncbi:MAG: RiPP maturation radical SAM C-methyltransferase [Pseudomonadota bacterium]
MRRESTSPVTEICLVVPPFDSMHYPQLGTAILKSACMARGLDTRIVYAGIALAKRVGLDAYDAISHGQMKAMVGERLFRPHAYPQATLATLPPLETLSDAQDADYRRVVDAIAPMLDEVVEQILALRPRIVGVSSTFEQNLAASSIARRVKEADPTIVTVMGGANAAWPLSLGLAKAFPWIDHFFAGEADIDFPEFCENYLRRGVRADERVIHTEPIRDMREVFAPDYSDFFATLRPLQTAGLLPAWLPRYLMMETSRGCWWGAKNHCTFCGLNGEGMTFREKPVGTVVDELDALEHWGVDQVFMTDNIMPMRYLRELWPALAARGPRMKMFYEVKANLTEEQLDTMALGGIVAIQPGIESLSSDVLKLMRKGVSAHQNIALLRHCRGIGMRVHWGMIYGFPGEQADHYEAMIGLIPKLAHLHGPTGRNPILIDRYSPYYNDPIGLGIGEIAPFPGYRQLYPPDVGADEVGYHFSGSYTTPLLSNPDLIARLHAAMDAWKQAWRQEKLPALELFDIGNTKAVLDTRAVARAPLTPLTSGQVAVLLELEKPIPRRSLAPEKQADADWLIARDFVIDYEDRLMSIVVRARHDVTAQSLLRKAGALEAAA